MLPSAPALDIEMELMQKPVVDRREEDPDKRKEGNAAEQRLAIQHICSSNLSGERVQRLRLGLALAGNWAIW